jgi:hypothetical protein
LHGAGNGILTIARGTLPIAIFGPENYAYRLGLIGAPSRICQALAPLAFGLQWARWCLLCRLASGATSGRIADLTRWELLRPKDFALPRYFCGKGLGLGNSRQQRADSRYKKSKDSTTNSPTHCHATMLLACVPSSLAVRLMQQTVRDLDLEKVRCRKIMDYDSNAVS